MAIFARDGLKFHYREAGVGIPFVFQHGLGADVDQPLGIFTPPPGIRLIAFDCRFHGRTEPDGPSEKLTFQSFVNDFAALLEHLQIPRAIVGGISMGAALALKFALSYPGRVLGLILSRPAWLTGPNLENAARFGLVADLLRKFGVTRGKQELLRTESYQQLANESPDAAESLCAQFDKPRAVRRADRLDRIPRDSVVDSLLELRTVEAPALVLSNRRDPIHPFEFGEAAAGALPNSLFQEISPKSISRDAHEAEVQQRISTFLMERFYRN